MHSMLAPEECQPEETLWLVDRENLHVNTHTCRPHYNAVLPTTKQVGPGAYQLKCLWLNEEAQGQQF
jgi:hypothetical protein